jgi:CheY-like chemotaxis protein
VHVAPLIQNMRPLLRNVLGPGITKEFDLDSDDVPVMADPTQLEVAVLNLAINARDAMPNGGVLKFATQRTAISDDPDVRAFIAAALEEHGYRVRQAGDGREGLAEIAREAPDLVIIDFIMPGMSGAEVANRIRARLPDQPILFVSGYSETDAVKRTAPDAPLLAKPFRADALHKAVRGAIAGKG